MARICSIVVLAFCLIFCSRLVVSPPRLVGHYQTEAAIEEFLSASKMLAVAWGFSSADYEHDSGSIRDKVTNASGFLTRISPEDVPYRFKLGARSGPFAVPPDFLDPKFLDPKSKDPLKAFAIREFWTRYYIETGAHASMVICRNYLSGLRERNEHFEFLQKEFNIAGGLATLTLALTGANATLLSSIAGAKDSINQGLDAYQEFRYLSVDVETVIPVVESAQIALRDHFLGKTAAVLEPAKATSKATSAVKGANVEFAITTTATVKATGMPANLPNSFAGAVYAVNKIDYACTRSGVRSIINKSLIQSVPKFTVDNGILVAVPSEKK